MPARTTVEGLLRLALLVLSLAIVGCSSSPRFATKPEPPAGGGGAAAPASDINLVESGNASYYAEEFNGRKTSSGEKYNMNDLTAAHRTLPFNTLVRVTNLANGRSVVVRINDRGPFKGDRVIDLSKAAAKEIGLIQSGTAQVQLEVMEVGGAKP